MYAGYPALNRCVEIPSQGMPATTFGVRLIRFGPVISRTDTPSPRMSMLARRTVTRFSPSAPRSVHATVRASRINGRVIDAAVPATGDCQPTPARKVDPVEHLQVDPWPLVQQAEVTVAEIERWRALWST